MSNSSSNSNNNNSSQSETPTQKKEKLSPLEQKYEEWYALYGQLDEFQKQTPQKHPLYQFAGESVVKNESCDYQRGAYDAMAKTMQTISMAKRAAQAQSEAGDLEVDWESIFIDMLRLRIGITMRHALKKWPEEHIPKAVLDSDPKN